MWFRATVHSKGDTRCNILRKRRKTLLKTLSHSVDTTALQSRRDTARSPPLATQRSRKMHFAHRSHAMGQIPRVSNQHALFASGTRTTTPLVQTVEAITCNATLLRCSNARRYVPTASVPTPVCRRSSTVALTVLRHLSRRGALFPAPVVRHLTFLSLTAFFPSCPL